MLLVGAEWVRYDIATDCRTLGSFRVKGVAFDCKPRVPQVKMQVKV
jgi:hypothetical protein